MKKILTLIAMAMCFNCVFAAGESDSTSVNNAANYQFYKNFTHWSLAVSGGFNYFMGERGQAPGEGIRNHKDNFLGAFNFEGEYSVNPIWGVALNYVYTPITRTGIFRRPGEYSDNPDENGQAHQIYAMLNINQLNLFLRKRDFPKWNWYVGAGLGILCHNVSDQLYYPKDTRNIYWQLAPMIPFESKVEYSPINALGIFLKVNMSIYLSDIVNIDAMGPLCDWNLYGGIGVRWMINGQKKTHVRVVDMNTYQYIEEKINYAVDTATQNEIKKLEKQLKDLQKAAEADAKRNICCDKVPPVDEKADNNTANIKALIADLDTLKTETEVNTEIANNSVYYAHNSSVVTEEYLMIVEKVARIMMTYPQLNLQITSFCSKPGSSNYNKVLGKKRIDSVYTLLVNKYNISPDRITFDYFGQVFEGLESENRRCDLVLK